MNIQIMSPKELVRWYIPTTETEKVLLDAIENSINHDEEIQDLEDRIQGLENEVIDLENINEDLREQVDNLQDDNDMNKNNVEELQEEVSSLYTKIDDLEDELRVYSERENFGD